MEPMLEAFRELASQVSYSLPTIPIISNLTGEPLQNFDAGYWVSQVRQAVLFGQGLEKAAELGVTTFLECGPGAALSLLVRSGNAVACEDGIPSLGKQGELEGLMAAAGRLYEHQQSLDWNAFFQPFGPRRVDLPTYAFQRERYWPIPEAQSPVFCKLEALPWNAPKQLSHHDTTWQTVATFAPTSSNHLVLDLREHSLAPAQLAGRLLAHLQEWLRQPSRRSLTVVTSHALPFPEHRPAQPIDPAGAAVWGLCRALRHEYPGVTVRLLDTDRLSEELLKAGPELPAETMLRDGKAWELRLAPCQPVSRLSPLRQTASEHDGTVLLTGATGGLGRALALHLVREHGVKHLLLLSRSGQQGAPDLPARLKEAGAVTVTILACDVGVRDQVAAALEAIPSQHPLVAVFHLAAVLRDSIFSNQSQADLEAVFSPKWDGACHLDSLTRDCPSLTHFVLFSSVTGLLGNTGQANYAAANAALDALAWQRHRSGLPALSLAWSGWAETGMAARMVSGQPDIPLMSIAQGLHALDVALRQPEPNLAILPSQPNLELHHSPLLPGSSEEQKLVTHKHGEWTQQLARLDSSQRLPWILDMVKHEAARVLGLQDPTRIPSDRPLQELGLDSLMAVELRNRLAGVTELALPASLAFDYPESLEIAKYLMAEGQSVQQPDWTDEEIRRKISMLTVEAIRESGLVSALMRLNVTSQSSTAEDLDEIDETSLLSMWDDLLGGKANS
jgi:acyl transferase domain-containing protein